ncbi:LysE family transporter [Paenibacillus silagei]|uniref:Threonine/homoserine/homoserine lactone efflux protein n=1 Tax=Paenibacillus silagei TaxID=1670801 RepID=A0ABS4NKB4_9BACL|nr:LysE family transporter [Paenibacillus silagei]MBP2110495.1 threonine/homoserine/homoserine lactone efflux protein [Paenibacillus silagei]
MNSFLTYIVLGISLSAPMGPINVAQLDRGARMGFLQSWMIGLGAMCADLVYMLLIYFGLAHFLNTPFMKTFLWTFGSFVLLYTGIDTLKNTNTASQTASRGEQTSISAFHSGFLMALMNPLSILFWLGIYGSILAKSMENQQFDQVLWNSIGIFVGILFWDLVMAMISSLFHQFTSPAILRFISLAAGICLLSFGLYFGYQAIIQLFA